MLGLVVVMFDRSVNLGNVLGKEARSKTVRFAVGANLLRNDIPLDTAEEIVLRPHIESPPSEERFCSSFEFALGLRIECRLWSDGHWNTV